MEADAATGAGDDDTEARGTVDVFVLTICCQNVDLLLMYCKLLVGGLKIISE